MRKILCATDLLPKSEAAIERAALLAGEMNARLTLLHVVEPGESERATEDTVQNAIARMRARGVPPMWRHGPTPNVIVRTGDPFGLILDTARETAADLVVLGPHRRRGLRDALEGTVAAKVLEARQAPVLIVRDEPRGAYENILLALDLTGVSRSALAATESLVLTPDARARVLHAFDAPRQGLMYHTGFEITAVHGSLKKWRERAARSVRDMLRQDSANSSRYEVLTPETPAAPAILRAMETHRPDLLVMGTRGRGRIARALLGSVANQIVHAANADVLVVPEGTFERAVDRPAARAGNRSEANHSVMA